MDPQTGSPPEHVSFDPATPADWAELQSLGHRMLDDMFRALRELPNTPVWRAMPEHVERAFTGPVPTEGAGATQAYAQFRDHVLPYGNGNWHPRFFGWVQGNGTPLAMLADMLASGMNPHLAGFNQAPARVEQQVIRWLAELMGMPGASGLFVTGGTMANVHGLACARITMARRLGRDARRNGMQAWPGDDVPAPFVFYASTETHGWARKAAEWLGLGDRAWRRVPVGDDFTMRMDALEEMIAADRAAGLVPFCVIGTAGTVNTGASDDLQAIAACCAREQLWFHVDGAFGALAALSPALRPQVAGMEYADSLAFDLHKWGSMPFECACALVRDPEAHVQAFTTTATYLGAMTRGPSAGGQPFNERGLDLTRGFKALKVWMQLYADGVNRFAAVLEQNVAQVRHLVSNIEAHEELELLAPAPLNVVCFRFRPTRGTARTPESAAALDALNREVLLRLQERGLALPSSTIIRGQFALRVAHVNHRTTIADIESLVQQVVQIGREVDAQGVAEQQADHALA